MAPDLPPEPWRSFLAEIDAASPSPIEMHCIGGFAVTQHYALLRGTGDIDICYVIPAAAAGWLAALAGKDTELSRRHGVYLQMATVATLPEGYADRLVEIFRGSFKSLRVMLLDPYGLALSKLERNSEVDMEDVKHLARVATFDLGLLERRYHQELRPFLAGPKSRHDLTLRLWLDAMAEDSGA